VIRLLLFLPGRLWPGFVLEHLGIFWRFSWYDNVPSINASTSTSSGSHPCLTISWRIRYACRDRGMIRAIPLHCNNSAYSIPIWELWRCKIRERFGYCFLASFHDLK
jgi:hypothetical protein